MASDLLIYGSYGYIGRLVANQAIGEGLAPILAGRDAQAVEAQATSLGMDHRVFSLEHPRVMQRQVQDVDAVLNCAGPFSQTTLSLLSACLEVGTDYLDLAGAVDVLEDVAARDAEADAAGVTALPGVGFDVVATDCLAASLHDEVLSADRLTIALDGLGTFSPGTVTSIIERLGHPGVVRENGRLRDVPAAWKTQRFDFGDGPKPAVTVPWGEVSTAYYSTGIPNVETYATVPGYVPKAMRASRPLRPIFGTSGVQSVLKRLADAAVSGPTAEDRHTSRSRIWGEVVGEDGRGAMARIKTPDTYDLAAMTAVEAARRTLAGDVEDGFQTPASAFGPEFVFDFEGVREESLDGVATVQA